MDYRNEVTALSDEALELIGEDVHTEEEGFDTEVETEDVELEDIEEEEYESEEDGDDYEEEEEYYEEDAEDEDEEYEDDDDYIEELEIEGIGTVSIQDIIDWRQGNMRQSDYTRKTQELARQREELKDAIEVYDYLKSKPYLLKNIMDGEPVYDNNLSDRLSYERQAIRNLEYKQKAMEVDQKLNDLYSKYGNIDEVALFEKATELGTEDLEFVWKGIMNSNNAPANTDELKEQLRQEILAELSANKSKVRTTVNTRQTTNKTTRVHVSDDERRVAEGLGLSVSEYLKWRG